LNICSLVEKIFPKTVENMDYYLSESEMLSLLCKEEVNTFGFYYPIKFFLKQRSTHEVEDEDLMYAWGLYYVSSLFNHSCAPNIYKRTTGRGHIFRALHDIGIGTPLTHCYVDLHINTNQRRKELLDHYGFHCVCERCEDINVDMQFSDDYVCPKYECGGLIVYKLNSDQRRCNKCDHDPDAEEHYGTDDSDSE